MFMVFFLVIVSVSLFSAEYQKPRFYIKVKGIGSLTNGGDYGDFVDLNEPYFTNLNNTPGYNNLVTKTPYFRGYGGEIGIETRRFAVGISGGYIEQKFQLDFHFAEEDTGYENNYIRDYTFSAIPIFLFIHYKVINTSFFKAFLTLGEGVYLAKYRDERTQTFENYELTFVNSYVESRKNQLGFHAGVTLDFNITRNLALFVEAAYRLVRFKDLEAEDFYEDDENTGVINEDFLYYRTNRRTREARFNVGESGGIFWDEALAKFNLNGFYLSVN